MRVVCVHWLALKQLTDIEEVGNLLTAGSTQVKDLLTGLIWERGISDGTQTWDSAASLGSAQAYCQSLTLGGHSWRLPTIKELSTLLSMDVIQNAGVMTNTTVFPAITGAMFFWSSSANLLISGMAWGVNFQYGWVNFADYPATSHVRCVKSQ
jgi:hypothetical protein